MADLTPDQLDALAKGIATSGIAQEKTLQALVKALGGSTGMASWFQVTGNTAQEMKSRWQTFGRFGRRIRRNKYPDE